MFCGTQRKLRFSLDNRRLNIASQINHQAMGTFRVKAKVSKVGEPESSVETDMIVDTGATYTTLPASLLRQLGVGPIRKIKLRIASGRIVERNLGEVTVEIQGRKTTTPVVFGNKEVRLLGSVTLEELSFAADPVARELVPTEAYLLVARSS